MANLVKFVNVKNLATSTDISTGDWNVSTGKHYYDIIFDEASSRIITHGHEYKCDAIAFKGIQKLGGEIFKATETANTIIFQSSTLDLTVDADGVTINHKTIPTDNAAPTTKNAASVIRTVESIETSTNGHVTKVNNVSINLKVKGIHYIPSADAANFTISDSADTLGANAGVITGLKRDSNGHIISVLGGTLPTIPTTAEYSGQIVITDTSVNLANKASTNPFINFVQEGEKKSSARISGSNNITISADAIGNITVDGSLLATCASLDALKTGEVSTNTANIASVPSNLHSLKNTVSSTYAPKASPALTGTPTAPTAAADTSTTQIATTAMVQNAIIAKLKANDAMLFKGVVNKAGDLPNTHEQGWTYKVATAGAYAGGNCEVGDMIICVADGTTAKNSDWAIIQTNIDGAVTGPATSVTERVAVYNGTTGKVIKDGGKTINEIIAAAHSGSYKQITTSDLYRITTDNKGHIISAEQAIATADKLGGIKIGYSTSGKNYAIQLDANNKAYVNVPWTDNNTHYTVNAVCASTNTATADVSTTSNPSTFINIFENSEKRHSYQFKGSGITTITSNTDASKNTIITVNSSIPLAQTSVRGGIKTGYAQSGNNYPVQLSNEQAYVNVPWKNSVTKLVCTSTSTSSTEATTATPNTATFLNLFDDTTKRSSIQIKGENGVTASAINNIITIKGTTYTLSGLGGIGTINSSTTTYLTNATKSGTTATLGVITSTLASTGTGLATAPDVRQYLTWTEYV